VYIHILIFYYYSLFYAACENMIPMTMWIFVFIVMYHSIILTIIRSFFLSHRRPSLTQSIHRNIHANNEFLLHHVTGRFTERMSAYFRTHSTGVACARTGNNAAAAATWVDYAHHTSSAAAALCTQPLRLHQQLIYRLQFLLGKRKLHF